ncbi:aldo/keto reductase [Reyranella sp. CPCC 100927]|uniref:aldo/keto reductase n=1 Tax=Reyranella sp. CPCC 100927 TaxID=2599616 RepID=UPI0011B696A7|nr:aldo/keto reductase [Reyranella sp. CPCC 100927]TWT15150.1 aldo/keto reductase [Reyranella sp. CPCC 100927]
MNGIPLHPFGRSGVAITRLGLGTAPLGGLFAPVSDAAAEATVARAWELGIRYFDTAPLYGFGLAERRLGPFLRSQTRDSFVLSTKVGRLLRRTTAGQPPDDPTYKGTPPERAVFDFSYDGVMRSVDESLARLGLDRIDILFVHDPDDHHDAAVAGAFQALARLRGDGTVRAIGAGMNQHEMLVRFADEAPCDGFLLAGRYSLLDQSACTGLMALCAERGIGLVLGGVFNSGILANPHPGATFNYATASPELVVRARRLDILCRAHGTHLTAAAIQFALAHPAVSGIVLGARTAHEIEENAAMARLDVPTALWADIRREGLVDPAAPLPGDAR